MALQIRSRSRDVTIQPDLGSGRPGLPVAPRRHLRLDTPWLTGLLTLLAVTGFVLARWQKWAQGHIGSFILLGNRFATDPGQIAPGIPIRGGTGYDGQFYYRLALNPSNLHQTAYGITMDAPYRFMRILYPALAWLFSAGQRAAVPVTLVAVNVAAIAVLGYLGGLLARDGGRHALWGLLLPLYFGLLSSVSRDTAEPVACAFLIAGLIAYRRGRPVLAGVLLACGALTRETALVAVLAIAVVRLWPVLRARAGRRARLMRRARLLPPARLTLGARPAREDMAWLIPVTVFAAWEVVLYLVTGTVPVGADGGRNAGLPLFAPLEATWDNLQSINWGSLTWTDIWLVELATLLAVAGVAFACWRRTHAGQHERLALLGYLAEILVVTPSTWSALNADLRSFVELYLLAVVVLLGVPPSRRRRWLLPAVALCVLPALWIVGSQRIFWS